MTTVYSKKNDYTYIFYFIPGFVVSLFLGDKILL